MGKIFQLNEIVTILKRKTKHQDHGNLDQWESKPDGISLNFGALKSVQQIFWRTQILPISLF